MMRLRSASSLQPTGQTRTHERRMISMHGSAMMYVTPPVSTPMPETRSNCLRGLDLLRSGDFFEAHEELELAWRAAAAEERDFFQGLVHFAVAWYQAGRGNRRGCERQLEKAARRLA